VLRFCRGRGGISPCVQSVWRNLHSICVSCLQQGYAALSKRLYYFSFPDVCGLWHHVQIKNTVTCVLLRCIVQTVCEGSGLRVRLVITLWAISYHLLSAKSVWSLLKVKHCVGNKSGSVTTGCYLNSGVEMLLCACNQWIGWSVIQAMINISWLFVEVAQLFGCFCYFAYFVRLASS
jgi:hypothetical protein